jgi:hypothetical protein
MAHAIAKTRVCDYRTVYSRIAPVSARVGMGLRLPRPRAARGSAVVNGRTWRKTCGGHVINRSKNSWLSLCVLGCIRFGNKEGVVVERLCHQSDRDPAEGVPDELFSTRFGEVERHNRNLAFTVAPLRDLAG